MFFKINNECSPNFPTNLKNCPTTADFVLCFPSIMAGETVNLACPFTDDIEITEPDS